MRIAVKQSGLFIENVALRGARMAQATARLTVEVDGRRAEGSAVQCLAPGFFTGAGRPYRDEVAEMLHVIETACDFAVQVTAGKRGAESVFDLWQGVYLEQGKWAGGEGYGPGLWMMGLGVMERAVIEGVCAAKGATLSAAVRTNLLGVRLGELHAELAAHQPAQLLPAGPPAEAGVCRGIALGDAERMMAAARGLPDDASPVHLLGGEGLASVGALRELWEKLRAMPEHAGWLARVAWISQPVNRETAMSVENEDALLDWEERPAILIDASNCGITSAAEALESGYAGAVHRDCRGVMKGVADACLMEHRRRVEPGERAALGVGDSLSFGAAARAHDLAGAASLGIGPLVVGEVETAGEASAAVPVDEWAYGSLGE